MLLFFYKALFTPSFPTYRVNFFFLCIFSLFSLFPFCCSLFLSSFFRICDHPSSSLLLYIQLLIRLSHLVPFCRDIPANHYECVLLYSSLSVIFHCLIKTSRASHFLGTTSNAAAVSITLPVAAFQHKCAAASNVVQSLRTLRLVCLCLCSRKNIAVRRCNSQRVLAHTLAAIVH